MRRGVAAAVFLAASLAVLAPGADAIKCYNLLNVPQNATTNNQTLPTVSGDSGGSKLY